MKVQCAKPRVFITLVKTGAITRPQSVALPLVKQHTVKSIVYPSSPSVIIQKPIQTALVFE